MRRKGAAMKRLCIGVVNIFPLYIVILELIGIAVVLKGGAK